MRNPIRLARSMDFVIGESETNLRSGKLTWKKNDRELSLDTPACLLYTKSGCVPHLTHDTLRLSLFGETLQEKNDLNSASRPLLPLLFPVAAFLPHRKSLNKFNDLENRNGVTDYVGVASEFDVISFSTQNDPIAPLPAGYNAGSFVSLWNYAGKSEVTPDIAWDVTMSMAPDVAQILADVDVGFHAKESETTSRQTKAVKRSGAFPRKIVHRLKDDDDEKRKNATGWWATAIVGLQEKLLHHYVKELSQCGDVIEGYVIDGLQPTKNVLLAESSAHVERSVQEISRVLAALPATKPRLLSHVATPAMVVRAVEGGVDLFDTSFAVVVTDRGGALVFDCDFVDESSNVEENSTSALPDSNRVVEINLNDVKYAQNFSPLLPGCPCHACSVYTKAYVHHLLVTQELLAQVLLMIHNQFHYTKFFDRIRKAVAGGHWERFKSLILSHRHEVLTNDDDSDKKRGAPGEGGRKKKKLVL